MAEIVERDARGRIVRPILTRDESGRILKIRWQHIAALDALGEEELRKLYWDDGLSCPEIARKFDVAKGDTVRERMRAFGIPLRDRSDSGRRAQAKVDPETRARVIAAVRQANTGRPVSADNLARRAVSRQANPTSSRWEKALLDALAKIGLIAIPLCAFGPFSLDLAFPEDKLAVEIGNENHRGAKIVDIDTRKTLALREAGWRLVNIATKHIEYNAPSAAAVVASALAEERAIRERERR